MGLKLFHNSWSPTVKSLCRQLKLKVTFRLRRAFRAGGNKTGNNLQSKFEIELSIINRIIANYLDFFSEYSDIFLFFSSNFCRLQTKQLVFRTNTIFEYYLMWIPFCIFCCFFFVSKFKRMQIDSSRSLSFHDPVCAPVLFMSGCWCGMTLPNYLIRLGNIVLSVILLGTTPMNYVSKW